MYRQILGILIGTNCAHFVADLYLLCYQRRHVVSLIIIKLMLLKHLLTNSASRYLDVLLNIDNPYFEQKVRQIYSIELELNKANSFDTEAHFWTWIVYNEWFSFI